MKLNRRKFIEASAVSVAASLVAPAGILRPRSGGLRANDANVQALLSRMTLEEKVWQMIQANSASLKDQSDVEKLFLGSILSGGSSDPKNGNSLIDWTDHYDSLQSRAQNTRLKIPILYGIDAVHGHSNVLGAVIFPHNIGLGCSRRPDLVERAARITAVEAGATKALARHLSWRECWAKPRSVDTRAKISATLRACSHARSIGLVTAARN